MPVFLTRCESFSSAHRLHASSLSGAENEQLYGKCNWVHGHGHNYRVEVTVAGEADSRTGMLVSLAELKACIWDHALAHLDHRNIDQDVPFFAHTPSTTENVARYIWEQLCARIPAPATLFEIKLYETDNNYVVYRS